MSDRTEDGLAGIAVLDATFVVVALQAIVLAGTGGDAGAVITVALVAALGAFAATLQEASSSDSFSYISGCC